MRYLGLFIISYLFTLNAFATNNNAFATDVCKSTLIPTDICNPLWASNVALIEVQTLINQGFNFEQRCNRGNTPLSLLSGREFYSDLLGQLSEQERAGRELIQTIKSYKSYQGRWVTPPETLVDDLLYRYRNLPLNPVNYRDKEDGKTALMWAAQNSYVWVVKTLLGASDAAFYWSYRLPALDITDNEGKTALTYAVLAQQDSPFLLYGYPTQNLSIRQLLFKGANINAQDNEGKTPLMHAVLGGKRIKIRILIEKGADIDMEDHQRNTAIRHAARAGRNWAVRFLISKGATYNAIEIEELLDSVPWYIRHSWDIGLGQYANRALGSSL